LNSANGDLGRYAYASHVLKQSCRKVFRHVVYNGRVTMNKQVLRMGTFFSLALIAGNVLAQETGCVDSPENPTVVLGLLGGAVASANWLRKQLKSRGSSQVPETE